MQCENVQLCSTFGPILFPHSNNLLPLRVHVLGRPLCERLESLHLVDRFCFSYFK